MKVSLLQDNFHPALKALSKAVLPKSTLPVLSNVLLATDNGRLRVSTTNLEMAITCWVGANVKEDGAITVPHAKLTNIVASLSPERIDLDTIDRTEQLIMECGATTTTFKGIDAINFPVLPIPSDDDPLVIVTFGTLKKAFNRIDYAGGKKDEHTLKIVVKDRKLILIAHEDYRIARGMIEVVSAVDESKIVPIALRFKLFADALKAFTAKGIDDEDEIHFVYQGKNLILHSRNMEIVLWGTNDVNIDPYMGMFEHETPNTVHFDAVSLYVALKRAKALFAGDKLFSKASPVIQVQIERVSDLTMGIIRLTAKWDGAVMETILDATVSSDTPYDELFSLDALMDLAQNVGNGDNYERVVLSYADNQTNRIHVETVYQDDDYQHQHVLMARVKGKS